MILCQEIEKEKTNTWTMIHFMEVHKQPLISVPVWSLSL